MTLKNSDIAYYCNNVYGGAFSKEYIADTIGIYRGMREEDAELTAQEIGATVNRFLKLFDRLMYN